MKPSHVALSKAVSHALRHEPWLYELELDPEGWTPMEALVRALRTERGWDALTARDVATMVQTAEKQRHEISGDRIRALYGHSLPDRIAVAAGSPPDVLFHGTAPATIQVIRSSGLLPMRRQYVHLSVDIETAQAVGSRKAPKPVILSVDTAAAIDAGVTFYAGNAKVWLADSVPPAFITGWPDKQ